MANRGGAVTTAADIDNALFHPAIALDAIVPSKTNPRKHFDETDLAELAQSIKDKGVIQPIVVRPHPKNGVKAEYEIVAGERRWRASKLAGVLTIPAIERRLDDKAVLEIQVIENLQRADIHPLEEANGYRELLDKHEYTIETIAAKVGKSESYIYQRLKLSELIPPVQKLFLENEITAGHAILIARLSREEQKEVIEEEQGLLWSDDWIGGEPTVCSVRILAKRIKDELYLDLAKAPWKQNDTKLLTAVGPCTSCPKRSGANPGLFAEIEEKNICTDRKCYNEKLDAFMKRAMEDGGLIRITSDFQPSKTEGVLCSRQYEEIYHKDDRCKFTQKALIVEGYARGTTKDVCVEKTCTKHHARSSSSSSSSSDNWQAQEKKRLLENKIKRAKIVALMEAVHKSTPEDARQGRAPIDRMLEETVRKMWDWANMPDQKAVALAIGLEKKTTKQGGYEHDSYDPSFNAYLKEHNSHGDLIELVMLIVAGRCYEGANPDWVRTWAKQGEHLGKKYDVAHIEAEVAEKFKPKKAGKKSKSQTSAKSKSKPTDDDIEELEEEE